MFRLSRSDNAHHRRGFYLAPALLALIVIALSGQHVQGQTTTPFNFRAGQAMYIVAFRQTPVLPVPLSSVDIDVSSINGQREYLNYDLDAERKVRKRIEEWRFFRVADKPSEADFIFLVNLDESSMEALALPFDAYRQHFKDKFDLDALREAAYGRYLIGPLKLATISRLSDRLVKQFREKLTQAGHSTDKRSG
jgi:hypothetical protein